MLLGLLTCWRGEIATAMSVMEKASKNSKSALLRAQLEEEALQTLWACACLQNLSMSCCTTLLIWRSQVPQVTETTFKQASCGEHIVLAFSLSLGNTCVLLHPGSRGMLWAWWGCSGGRCNTEYFGFVWRIWQVTIQDGGWKSLLTIC